MLTLITCRVSRAKLLAMSGQSDSAGDPALLRDALSSDGDDLLDRLVVKMAPGTRLDLACEAILLTAITRARRGDLTVDVYGSPPELHEALSRAGRNPATRDTRCATGDIRTP